MKTPVFKEYVSGFKLGQGLGFQLGKLAGISEMMTTRAYLFLVSLGATIGYIIGRITK